MIIDSRNKFCEDEAASGTQATRLEGDVIDLKTARDIGNGQPVYAVITVSTAFTSGTSSTVNFQIVSDAQEAIATDGSATVHAQTGAVAHTELTAGKRYVLPLPLEGREYERYLGLLVVTGAATTTAGAITAFLSLDPDGWKAYPEGNS
jgi:hypothetical protein